MNTNWQINSDHILVSLKKETLDHLREHLKSQGDTTTTYDDIIQEWTNWQIKAHAEAEPRLPHMVPPTPLNPGGWDAPSERDAQP
jgi:hypothetical protein